MVNATTSVPPTFVTKPAKIDAKFLPIDASGNAEWTNIVVVLIASLIV